MALSEIINKIRTAVYGREIRNSIADGLEEINKIAENSNSLSEMAMQTAYGATIINYNAINTTSASTVDPSFVDGTNMFSILGDKLRPRYSGKYLYFIIARRIRDLRISYTTATISSVEMLSSVQQNTTEYMYIGSGVISLEQGGFLLLEAEALNGNAALVNGLKLVMIKIG